MEACLVPYTLHQKVTDELNRLKTEGIIERVTHSEWAAPIVPVLKTNGQVRPLWRFSYDCEYGYEYTNSSDTKDRGHLFSTFGRLPF